MDEKYGDYRDDFALDNIGEYFNVCLKPGVDPCVNTNEAYLQRLIERQKGIKKKTNWEDTEKPVKKLLTDLEKVRNDNIYKSVAQALKDNTKTLTSRESVFDDAESFIVTSNEITIPVASGGIDGSATLLTTTLPDNSEGKIFQVLIWFKGGTAVINTLTFSFLVNDHARPYLSKIPWFDTNNQPVDMKISLPNRSTIKVVGYNSDTASPQNVKVTVKGYYRPIPRDGF